MEFLNTKRFRRAENKSRHFRATLTWLDGTSVVVALDQDPNTAKPERIRYLPQQVIEKLCNEISGGSDTDFEKEMKKVIFFHLSEDSRLQKANLDELLTYRVEGHRKAIAHSQAKIRAHNAEIAAVERELSEEAITSLRTTLNLKQNELEAHDKLRPANEPQPEDDRSNPEAKQITDALSTAQVKLGDITVQLEKARTERGSLVARTALLDRLQGHVTVLENYYSSFVQDTAADFMEAGFKTSDIVILTVNRQPITLASAAVTDRLAEIATLIQGTAESKGLQSAAEDSQKDVDTLKGKLDAPQKRYHAYLAALNAWQIRRTEILGAAEKPDTIEFLKSRIQHATNVLPDRLKQLEELRRQCVQAIHVELLQIRHIYQELYTPVQELAASNRLANESLQLQLDAFFALPNFTENFIEYINRTKKGNFFGDEAGKLLENLVRKRDFHTTDDVLAFLDEIMTTLTTCERERQTATLTVESQLKKNKKPVELCDYLFCLEYLEPRYTLKLGDKDIQQLSPGEKGALLLVFHLLLDREEIPIIIDQPEHNLDNESVVKLLVDCIREATTRRQVIIVTHNPNLAVVCDADQIVCTSIDIADRNRFSLTSGAIEDYEMNTKTVNILEGTYRAFDNRQRKYA